jgi:hypothetical protein
MAPENLADVDANPRNLAGVERREVHALYWAARVVDPIAHRSLGQYKTEASYVQK